MCVRVEVSPRAEPCLGSPAADHRPQQQEPTVRSSKLKICWFVLYPNVKSVHFYMPSFRLRLLLNMVQARQSTFTVHQAEAWVSLQEN